MKKNHKNKFKTPVGYFDSFNDRLLDKIAQEESIIPKSDGFGVPESYFDTVYQNVSSKISENEPKVISLNRYKKYMYIAVSAAAVFLLIFNIFNNQNEELRFDDLANTEIETYFEDTDFGLTSYEIAQLVDVNTDELNGFEEAPLEEKTILEYIDDTTDMYDELNLDYEFEE